MKNKIDLGVRKVAKQNFSHIVALPHIFVDSFIDKKREVRCVLDVTNGTLTLIPITKRKRGYIKK